MNLTFPFLLPGRKKEGLSVDQIRGRAPRLLKYRGTPIPKYAGGHVLLGLLPALQQHPQQTFLAVMRQCGDVARFNLGPIPVVQISEPKLAGEILRNEVAFQRCNQVDSSLSALIGDVLTTHQGDEHHRRRRAMAPLFQPGRLPTYVSTLVELTSRKLAEWQDGQALDLGNELMQLTLTIAAQVFLSVDWSQESAPLIATFDAFEAYLTHVLKRLIKLPLVIPVARNRRARRGREEIGQRIRTVIEQRRAGETTGQDLLDALLKSGLQEKQVEDELLNILFNVFPSTATVLLTLHYLMRNPALYQRIEAEVDAVLLEGEVTIEKLKGLRLLLRAYKETQRLVPFVPALMRQACYPVTLPGGYRIPKGRWVVVAIGAIHRRADLYPNPDSFDLDHFSSEQEKRLSRNAYLAFGDGNHICLGNHYSLMQGPLVLALLMRRFHFDQQGAAICPEALSSVLQRCAFPVLVRRRTRVEPPSPVPADPTPLPDCASPPSSRMPARRQQAIQRILGGPTAA